MTRKFMKSTGLAALAASLALITMPAAAQEGRGRGGQEASSQRGNWLGYGNRGPQSAQRQAAPQRAERSVEARQPAWRGQPRAEGDRSSRQNWSGQRGGDGASRWNGQRVRERNPGTAAQAPIARQHEPRASTWQRNRDYTDAQRNRSYRDGSRDRNLENRRDNDRDRWQGNNNWRNDRWGYNQNTRAWNRDWRRDNRYNWHSYRNSNRNIYRIGRYYAPYRDYGYRRLSIGFGLDSVFFGSRYWINDPWQYRLPAVYGGYRWVRYFDDVLLVDTYSGQVVDVIYDFFW